MKISIPKLTSLKQFIRMRLINLIVLILLLFSAGRIIAQESDAVVNGEGKDISQLKHTWTAQWITHPTESTLDYGVFHFRRTFHISQQPDSFKIYISADNRYRLFVNGEYVCFGPSVGDINHYRYETVDIAKYLNTGKNVIAAEVVNFGEFRRAAQQTFMTAFILQSAKENRVNINTGDGQWKVTKNRAYECIPFTSDSVRGYYAAGPGDHVDASRYPWEWQHINYDDSNWKIPRKAMVEFAVGRGFLYGSTWYLVPRTIPFMEETEQRFKKVTRYHGCDLSPNFIQGIQPVIIPPNTKASILLDQGVHTVAYPELLLSEGKGSKIKATYSEALVFNEVLEENYVDGNQHLKDNKGNRNKTDGKSIFGIYDVFLPDGGNNRLFKPLWMRTFRFIQLDIETGETPLTIHDYKSIFSAYPFKELATFQTDDPVLSKIWEVAWRTTRNGCGEMFQDSPYYEQLQYIGDTRLESLVTIYVSGDDRLMRKAIKSFDDSRMPNGLTQSRYPSYINQVIPTYSLLWIGMLNDYFLYRNDPEFLRQFLPGMRSVLEWFEFRMDDTSLITNLEWWNFIDWAPEFSNGIPPGADNGYSAMVALQYIYAINCAVELFDFFGWEHEAFKYREIASRIKQGVIENCYDEKKGLFAETPEKKIFSQHTNTMAILTDVAAKEEQKKLMEKVLTEKDIIQSTIYFKFYLSRALQKTQLGDEYLNMLQPWKNMLDDGLTTFAETDINPRSDCHAWSATPCFDFLHLIAGIYPGEKGFEKVIVEPNFGHLSSIFAEMPHPKGGIIKVKLDKKANNLVKGTITLPQSISGTFLWRDKKVILHEGVNTIQ